MQTKKKAPVRLCVGCSAQKEKKELIRVVRSPEGEISIDRRGKKPGRGAYVCDSIECLRKARKSRRFERIFSCAIPDEIYAALEEELDSGG